MIRLATAADAAGICAIYNHYVENTVVTFEEAAVTELDMAGRIAEVLALLPWFVFEREGKIVGYAYATRWRVRSAYRFSAEATVYLDPAVTGLGIGSQLYRHLLAELKQRSIHCVMGGIALPNPGSVRLHEKLGFRKAAHFEQVGWKFDRWVDVGYWEITF